METLNGHKGQSSFALSLCAIHADIQDKFAYKSIKWRQQASYADVGELSD